MKKVFLAILMSLGLSSCATTEPEKLPECGAVIRSNFATEGWAFMSVETIGPNSLGFTFSKEKAVRLVVLVIEGTPDEKALRDDARYQRTKDSVSCDYQNGANRAAVYDGVYLLN
jgi:hypothetical protein